jgi:hypothetical protein
MTPFTCRICGCTPCASRGFCRQCREADRKHKHDGAADHGLPPKWEEMSVGALWGTLNDPKRHRTPDVTIEAIIHGVKARGIAALKEPNNLDRLSQCDEAAKAQINKRLTKMGVSHG